MWLRTQTLEKLAAGLVPLALVWIVSCGDGDGGSSTGPSPATTTVAPTSMLTEFTLRAADCTFRWSRPLDTLAVGESFTIRFKPQSVDDPEQTSDWLNTVEFWLDKLDRDHQNALALSLVYQPNAQWFVDFFKPAQFGSTGQRERINLGGRFRQITMVRAEGVSEWLLDGVSILQLEDSKPNRTVYTRVVGSEALFQFEETISRQRDVRGLTAPGDCLFGSLPLCAGLGRP